MEAEKATQTYCYNPVTPTYPVWPYYTHGQQRRRQEDPVSPPSSGLEKTTRSFPQHMAQHRPTGYETTPPYAPQSSRFGSEPPFVEDDVDVWRYAIVTCMPETTTNDGSVWTCRKVRIHFLAGWCKKRPLVSLGLVLQMFVLFINCFLVFLCCHVVVVVYVLLVPAK